MDEIKNEWTEKMDMKIKKGKKANQMNEHLYTHIFLPTANKDVWTRLLCQ